MKKISLYLCLVSTFLILSCGSDDDNNFDPGPDPIVKNSPFDELAVIAVQNEQIYQLDVDFESENVKETNLTTSFDLQVPYKIVTSDTHVTFVYRQGQKYSYTTKSYQNQNVETHEMICGYESSDLEAALSSNVVKDYLLIFTGSGDSYDELSVRSKHILTGNCQKVSFGQGQYSSFNKILYDQDQLIVSFTNLSGQYSIAYIDLASGETSTTTFDNYFSATFNEGMMHMLFNVGNVSRYEVYDPKDWTRIENKEFNSYLNFGTNGLVQTQMLEGKVLLDFQYSQPASIGNGPGILNLTTGELEFSTQILSILKTELEKKYNDIIQITTYKADLESRTLVVGYEVGLGGNSTGGLIQSNFEGEMIKDLSLPYPPYTFEFVD